MHKATSRLVLALFSLLSSRLPAQSDPQAEGVRPYVPLLPGTEPLDAEGNPELVAMRVLGRTRGELVPIAGARVSCWSEETGPEAIGSRRLGEGVTDEHGIANIEWDERGKVLVVERGNALSGMRGEAVDFVPSVAADRAERRRHSSEGHSAGIAHR